MYYDRMNLDASRFIFMYMGIQMKNVSMLTDARHTDRKDKSSLLDCMDPV